MFEFCLCSAICSTLADVSPSWLLIFSFRNVKCVLFSVVVCIPVAFAVVLPVIIKRDYDKLKFGLAFFWEVLKSVRTKVFVCPACSSPTVGRYVWKEATEFSGIGSPT